MIRKILTIFAALYLSTGFVEAQTFPIQNLNLLGQFQISGSPGIAGFVLQSNGAASPSWAPATGNSVANTAALQTLASTSATQIWRLGVNTVGDAAPLLFKSSNSACSLNSGNGDTGSQVKSSDNKCWLAVYPSGPIDAAEFGLDITGATDSTIQLQAAWNYAGTVGQNLKLPATNPSGSGFIKFSQLTVPGPVGYYGGTSALIGDLGNTVLKSTVTGTQCAISLTAAAGTPNYGGAGWGGWSLWSINNAGYGFCINGIAHLTSEQLYIINFNFGVYALDSISITMNRLSIINGQRAIYANIGTVSYPNEWNINEPFITGQTQDGFLLFSPADFNVRGGDLEGINVANASGFCSINVSGNPVNGTKGLAVFGGYYQENGGNGDICLTQNATGAGSGPGVHSITGVEFGRISNTIFVTHEVVLANGNSGAQTVVSMHGNSFNNFNSYVPSALRAFWAVSSPSLTNYKLVGWGDNRFGNTTEAPGDCLASSAANCINLPDGHLEEWNTATTSSGTNGSVAITYPLACPNAADSFAAWNANGGSPVAVATSSVTTTGATIIAATGPITVGWRLICH